MGRFIGEDPISFAGGDVNLYRYVGNNPVDSIDPMGRYAVAGVGVVVLLALVVIVSSNLVLQGRIRKRKKEKIERNPQPNPTPERIPVDPNCNEKKETCKNTYPYSEYAECEKLDNSPQASLYKFNSVTEAYNDVLARYKNAGGSLAQITSLSPDTKDIAKDGPCSSARLGSNHWNIFDLKIKKSGLKNPSIGSVTECQCCFDTPTGPKIRANKNNYASFPKY